MLPRPLRSFLVPTRSAAPLVPRLRGLTTLPHASHGTALVMGGAAGVGNAVSRRLAADGYSVVIGDLRLEQGSNLARDLNGLFVNTDVTSAEEVKKAVETTVQVFGSLDAVVNTAGGLGPLVPIGEYPLQEWQRVIDVNLNGTFNSMKYSLAQMTKQKTGGRIVNLVSTAAFRGYLGTAPYSAAKCAVTGLTRVAAVEYAERNIRVNAVAPTSIAHTYTDPAQTPRDFVPTLDPEELQAKVSAMNAQPGFVTASDLAAAVAFLLSEDARFITGTTLPVDAGALSRIANAREHDAW